MSTTTVAAAAPAKSAVSSKWTWLAIAVAVGAAIALLPTPTGLSRIAQLAERYGGSLELAWSELGAGSRFALRLPLAPAA